MDRRPGSPVPGIGFVIHERNDVMYRRTRTALAGMLSGALTAALLASPIPVAARGPASSTSAPVPAAGATTDLAPALAADGTFRGAPGVAGMVEAGTWNLVSDLAAGEAPRFAPASGTVAPAAATPAGTWAALGSSADGANGAIQRSLGPVVNAIAVIGTDLYVGGQFTDVAGIAEADYIARWDGSAWYALGDNGAGNGALNLFVNALAVDGPDLYVGGDFANAGGNPEADMIAKWSGGVWSALGSNGSGNGAYGINSYVTAVAVFGGDVYASAGGPVNVAGGGTRSGLVRYAGGAWTDVADWQYGANVLVASGGFLYLGSGGVWRWDGGGWTQLGSGTGAIGGEVLTLAVSGSTVYAGGYFQNAAGLAAADYVAKWNGSAWSALGSGTGPSGGALSGQVYALALSGSDLYVGGYFYTVGGNKLLNGIAKWNGSAWSALGDNGSGAAALGSGYARALVVSGTDLLVGGAFANAGGIAQADCIATWGIVPSAPVVVRKPDARIRLGTSGAWVGDNMYNTTGAGQSKTGSAKKGKTITFGISIQNDGTNADAFKVKATGSAASRYTVKYYAGTKDITAKVVAGTYKTASLAAGAAVLITVKVTIKTTAAKGSKVTRLVTITSVGSGTQRDAVKLIGKRK
jgi:hypothetical protein